MSFQPGATADVIIIGGGVIGLSTAYHLARKGVKRVVLLEKDQIGAGSSSRAGGIITGLLWTKTGIEARKISLALYQDLSVELGDYGYQFQAVGCLNLFDPGDWSEREKLLPLYADSAVPYEVIDAAEIHYRWSELTPDADIVGLFDSLGGYSEPDQYVPALAQRCRDMGVDIREGQQVTDFLLRKGRVSGVITATEHIEAVIVVCTIHAWTLRLLAQQNRQLPIKSFIHQRYTTTPLVASINIPAVNANPQGSYFRPAAGNRILAGIETADRSEYLVPSPDFRMSELSAAVELKDELRQNLVPLLPGLEMTTWESESVGLIAFSLDGEPILGKVPGLSGLLVGTAFHSGGFAYNPVAGQLLAELVVDNQTSIKIDAFAPDRFDVRDTCDYLENQVAQRNAVSRRH